MPSNGPASSNVPHAASTQSSSNNSTTAGPRPSYARSTETSIVLAIPGGEANLEFARIALEESQAGRPLSLDDLRLSNELWLERRLTTAEAARLIQRPETETRTRLARLVEVGLVEPRGEGQGRAYHLPAAV
jgi:ATP-dependent DNA helicase RecG